MGVATGAWGLVALAMAAAIGMMRYAGKPWSSPRLRVQGILMAGAAMQCASTAMVWANTEQALGNARATWRPLCILGFTIFWCIGLPRLGATLLKRALLFVGGMDSVCFVQLNRTVAFASRAFGLPLVAFSAGLAVALLGTTAEIQSTGALISLCGMAAASGAWAVIGLRVAHLLAQVQSKLDADSHSAKIVAGGQRKGMGTMAWISVFVSPCLVTIAASSKLRALSGVLFAWAMVPAACFFGAVFPLAVFRRLAPARQQVQRQRRASLRPAMSPRADRVHAAPCTATDVASHAANATKDIVADPARLEAVLAEQSRPEGLDLNGFSLVLMRRIADECSVDPDLTAAAVCARHIKPMTSEARLSLAALLRGGREAHDDEAWVGAPTHFISYAWSYSFRMLLDMVEQHEQEFPPPKGRVNYYFLDQLSLSQHEFVQTPRANPHTPRELAQGLEAAPEDEEGSVKEMQQQLVDALKAQMLKAGHVLMCLWPLQSPTPLKRAWCLFEAWVAIHNGIKLTMCFGNADAAALYAAVCEGSFDVMKLLGEIRAQDADCLLQRDKELILGLIENEMGVQRFNMELQEKLLGCMRQTVAAVVWKQTED